VFPGVSALLFIGPRQLERQNLRPILYLCLFISVFLSRLAVDQR
jgi:hypothetical protein